jgi:hypothetical protein
MGMDATRRLRTLGFLLALIATWFVVLVWFQSSVDCKVTAADWPKDDCRLTKFLFDWQQLLGGGFALVAAVIGWFAINRQIRQFDAQEQERVRAKRAAARAALPLALAAIAEYAEECAQRLALLLLSASQEGLPEGTTWHGPELPTEALLDIRTLVETLPSRDGSAFADLLSKIQIQASRLRSIRPSRLPNRVGVVVRSNIEQYIVDCAEIFARGAAMLRYARGLVDEVPLHVPTQEEIRSALGSKLNQSIEFVCQ